MASIDYDSRSKSIRISNECNAKLANATVGIKVNDQRVPGDYNVDSNGCLNLVINNISCDSIRIFGTDRSHSGQEFASQSCGSSKPSLPQISLNKVAVTAEQHARFYANREVESFNLGDANIAYNYILGMIEAERKIPQSNLYNSALRDGSANGLASGTPVGEAQGELDGTSSGLFYGKNSVTVQYRQRALNPSAEAEWKAVANNEMPSYSGGSYNGGKTTDYTSLMSTKSEIVRSQIRDNVLRQAILNRNPEFDIGTSWFNKAFAFDSFKSKYSNSDQMKYFNKLVEEYENGSEAQEQYANTFARTYANVIDEKIEKEVKSRNQVALKNGYNDASSALLMLAYNQGFNTSFESSAQQAARTTFAKSYPVAYQQAFKQQSQYLDNNSEIENLEVAIVDSEGKNEFVIGQPITLKILKMVNIGRKTETLKIKLSKSIEAEETITVKGLSQSVNVEFKDIAFISPTAKLDKQPVQVCVGQTCSDQTIELKWENQIKGLAKKGVTEKAAKELSAFIRGVLLDEWKRVYNDNKDQGSSDYDKLVNVPGQKTGAYSVDPKTYLAQFFKTMDKNKATPGFKEQVVKIGDEYLNLKFAMLNPEQATSKFVNGGRKMSIKLNNETEAKDLYYREVPDDQKAAVLEQYNAQQANLYSWVKSDAVLEKQMSDCMSKSKKKVVSCVTFMDEDESKYFRQWNLGNKPMTDQLNALNKAQTNKAK